MCASNQKSSYEHGSDFERLRKIRTIRSKSPVKISPIIQCDSGGICNTLGNDSMCDSKQKSSYEHGSDFERMVRIFFLPYLGNRSKSDPYSYELFCLESHILSFPKLFQIPPESSCIMDEIFYWGF